ncbi:unnamed protein product [Phytophthora fragariaefolia]|uniref:Unnamed protein product n=1 Tax=Phytophthora fragariaefolia TaxID=1490495 RepID=A0A9W6XFZ9_9STRA|nr:unnamed protein product [Phytophthora fragariaefolia]
MLVKHAADVNCVDKRGWTALHVAAANDRIDVVRELVTNGADITAKTFSNETPRALALEQSNVEVCAFLMGRDMDTVEVYGYQKGKVLDNYMEYLLDRTTIQFDSLQDNWEGFWLDSPIEVKEVESWHPITFVKELRRWSKLNHPHVIKLFGICHGSQLQSPLFVYERLTYPSLLIYLMNSTRNNPHCDDIWEKLYQGAPGLQYLHDRNIIHGDLKCDSIAIATNGAAKLQNLGSDILPIGHRHYPNLTAAPEVISGLPPSFDSDVYSFGITIIQAFTLQHDPWHLTSEAHHAAVLSGLLPDKPSSLTCTEWQLITRMCSPDPLSRSSVSDVVRQLEVFYQNYKNSRHNKTSIAPPRTTVGDISITELGYYVPMMLSEIDQMCKGSNTTDKMTRQLYERLEDTFSVLKERSDTPAFPLIEQYCDILKYYRSRLRSITSVGNAGAARLAASRRETEDTFALNRDLDSFMDRALLPRSSEIHQWREIWKRQEQQQKKEMMESLEDFTALFEDIPNVNEREKLLTYLRFELSNYPARYLTKTASNFTRAKSKISSVGTLQHAKWFIPPYEVEFDKFDEFSSGAFRSVHRGRWKHSEVVVKKLKLANDGTASFSATFEADSLGGGNDSTHMSEEVQTTFLNEVEIWHTLFHPHVVQLFGACHIGQPFFVCEYAGGGQLDDYLRAYPDQAWIKLYEAALGLRYLHTKQVSHGDLKCNNIVIGSDGLAKLTDFGLSMLNSGELNIEQHRNDPHNIGAIRWKAPEVLRGEKATFASDVYSFGMCILEAVSGTYPWGMLMDPVVKYLEQKRIPQRPENCSDEAYALVKKMCRFNPTDRIGMNEVVSHLPEDVFLAVFEVYGTQMQFAVPVLNFADSLTFYSVECILESQA